MGSSKEVGQKEVGQRNFGQKFIDYLREVAIEYKKISWPDRHELVDSTKVVIVFIIILAVSVALFDKVILFFLELVHGA